MPTLPAATRPRAHIAMVTVPLHGHVNPTLPLAEELASRGHRVSYATTEEFAPRVAALGATPVLTEGARLRWVPGSDEGIAVAAAYAASVLSRLLETFRSDPPDLVLHDVFAFAGPVIAARSGVPSMMLAPTHLPYQGWHDELGITEQVAHSPEMTALSNALAAHGLPVPPAHLLRPPARAIAFFPRAFQRNADSVRGQCAFVGPTTAAAPSDRPRIRTQGRRPTALVTLGTIHHGHTEFYRACLDAFTELPWHVVMAIGPDLDPARLGPIPGNAAVHARVPQAHILADADVFITHAGMGGTMEALSHAVPLVAVPRTAEQRVNAAQITALDLGVHLDPNDATPASLRRALATATTDPAIARGTAVMREHIHNCGGAPAAADAVDALLARTVRTTGRAPARNDPRPRAADRTPETSSRTP